MQNSSSENIEGIVHREYTVKIGDYISQGWSLVQSNIGSFLGYVLVFVAITLAVGYVNRNINPSLGSVINLVIAGPLTAGWYLVSFKLLKNRSTTFSDFFRGFNNFLPYFLANLLVTIFIAIGLILLILPGIYLAVAYLFTIPLIADKKMDFWEAMETSRKLVSKQWFSFFGFAIVLFLINLVGALLLGFGLLITIPLSFAAVAVAYADIVGLRASSDDLA